MRANVWASGETPRHHHHHHTMTATYFAGTDSKGATLPVGVEFDIQTNAYWVRADFSLYRRGRAWILEDQDTLEERRFRSESAGIAALAALA